MKGKQTSDCFSSTPIFSSRYDSSPSLSLNLSFYTTI
jgi:hypothetical protein